MEKTYIIVSKKDPNFEHGFTNPLGHEIHITRFILMDLLQKKKISEESIIVTLKEDRFFLYNNIFNHVIDWYSYQNIIKLDCDVEVDLTFYSYVDKVQYQQISIFDKWNYNLSSFEKTDKFIEYINSINFSDLNINLKYADLIKDKFIVIHVRSNIGNEIKDNSILVKKIIDKLNNKYKVVVFSVDKLNIDNENIIIINNLQIYASFLNHKNCELFISGWSGGGQLSQYCCNSKIIYYFDNYISNDYEIHYINYQKGANLIKNIFYCWDFKSTTNCSRSYFKTLDLMLLEQDLFY